MLLRLLLVHWWWALSVDRAKCRKVTTTPFCEGEREREREEQQRGLLVQSLDDQQQRVSYIHIYSFPGLMDYGNIVKKKEGHIVFDHWWHDSVVHRLAKNCSVSVPWRLLFPLGVVAENGEDVVEPVDYI
jgi:hypothetical protein